MKRPKEKNNDGAEIDGISNCRYQYYPPTVKYPHWFSIFVLVDLFSPIGRINRAPVETLKKYKGANPVEIHPVRQYLRVFL